MGVMLDLHVVQLLNSRLCHDLVGPVGAVNNGLELAADGGPEGFDVEAMDLVKSSAQQVTERLMFFRVAFGLAAGSVKTLQEAKKLLGKGVVGEKNTLIWPDEEIEGAWLYGDQALKLFLNMVHLAGECLPRGGDIEIFIEPDTGGNADRVNFTITAAGQGARIEESVLAAMMGQVEEDDLSPRSSQGYLLRRIAESCNGSLSVDYPQEDMVAIRGTAQYESMMIG